MELFGAAPCQCLTPMGQRTTSPALIFRIGLPHSCVRPTPEVTMSAYGVDMPVGTCARFKGDAAAAGTHVVVCRIQGIDADVAGENRFGAFDGRLFAAPDNGLRPARFGGRCMDGTGGKRQRQGHNHR